MNPPNPPPPMPRALTKEQIAILSRHASERAELEAEQHNARVELQARQRAEIEIAMADAQPLVPK